MLSELSALAVSFELRFRSLFDAGRALSFPCDAAGNVPIDSLRERERANYFYARALVGQDFATPSILPVYQGS